MLKKSLLFILLSCSLIIKAQDSSKVILSGSIKDSESGEALIGATIMAKSGVGAVADIEGNFTLALPKGDYVLEVSMLGYSKFTQKIKLYSNKRLEIKLENMVLDEVEVVADIAKIRETPVAFSSISATKIQEELGNQDISMIANTTPGAYASNSGGGAGDSRVTLRGFDQRNIGVLVDGIPVNDMENGQVYWSNWDGLKDITKSLQIQRGLGASKLAISSVGGTMNFITNSINDKQQVTVKKEWSNNRGNVMGLSYNSGLINNKWGFVLAGTYRNGDGWADRTWYNAYSYFVKVQYMPNPRHIISIGANGAPQSHGQRFSKMPISVYDVGLAEKLGAPQDSAFWYQIGGLNYVSKTSGSRDLTWNPDQALIYNKGRGDTSLIDTRVNTFHKPLFNLNHFWKISEKTTLSTVAYASIGKGGGTSGFESTVYRESNSGYYFYNYSTTIPDGPNGNSPGEYKVNNVIKMLNNNHQWFGILSTATTKFNKIFTATYGIDLRYYEGFHYTTAYNMLGGDYYYENQKDPNVDNTVKANFVKHKDDIYGQHYDSKVKWGGLFGQIEFKKDKWSAFFTATGSKSGYNRIDYYKNKDLIINGSHFDQAIRYGEIFYFNGTDNILAVRNATVTTNGDTTFVKNPGYGKYPILNATGYTTDSKEARYSNTDWKWQYGYTLKGGANYNINDHHNVFVNIGIMQIPQKLQNVFSFSNKLIRGFKPQKIQSYEIGYGLKYNKFNVSVNGYYTNWENQPQNPITGNDGEQYNVPGIDVLYKGIEFEGFYKPIKQIEVEGVVSIGDWRYNSASVIYLYDNNFVLQKELDFDARGVKIGNAAQTQLSGGVRIIPFNGFYIKPKYVYFMDNYANFNASDLILQDPDNKGYRRDDRGRQSWKMPSYGLMDLSLGYEIPINKIKINLYCTINNLLNTRYINDAQNNGAYQGAYGFNAASASVFFGVGRTYSWGTKLTF